METVKTGRKRSESLNLKAQSLKAHASLPLLILLPLNDTFDRKYIPLPIFPETIRVGRQTNAKTVPAVENGYFDSKVLSRQHAEIWADRSGRVWIRDIKSSNGTFVNGARLSAENKESEPRELKSQDVLELGIDIVAEDNKTVIHQKVASKVEHAGFPSAQPQNGVHVTMADIDPFAKNKLPKGVTIDMMVKKLSQELSLTKSATESLRNTAGVFANLTPPDQGQIASLTQALRKCKEEILQQQTQIKALEEDLLRERLRTAELQAKLQLPNTLTRELSKAQEELGGWRNRAERAEKESLEEKASKVRVATQQTPFVGAFAVMALGVGIMAMLNGWSKSQRL